MVAGAASTSPRGSEEASKRARSRVDQLSSKRKRERRAGLEGQPQAVAAACRGCGWQLLELVADARLPKKERKRPRVEEALRVREAADGKALVVVKRDRPAQALLDLANLLASAQQHGWALVALDCTLEPTTPTREATASLRATLAPCERQLVSQRTREALARTRAQGVRLGRPPTMPAHLIERIRRERKAGTSLAAIANGLNTDRIPTAQGGRRWYPATIRYTLNRTR